MKRQVLFEICLLAALALSAARCGQPKKEQVAAHTRRRVAMPDVAITNELGAAVHFSDFRRKAVLVTFVYTQCPIAAACPLVTSHVAELQRALKRNQALYQRTRLVTITLDPVSDTPPVLAEYGRRYLDDPSEFAHWEFGVTSEADLHRLAAAVGLYLDRDGGDIVHSMTTVLVAPDGRVERVWPINDWPVAEVLAALAEVSKSAAGLEK